MSKKRFGRAVLVVAAIGMLPLAAFADEIIHFTNGAEMTVRSHVVDEKKQMVRLDLGASNFISFPMAMVDKIVNAGRDVYLNPEFHPANQAIAGGAAWVPPDNSVHGIPGSSAHTRAAVAATPIPAVGGPIDPLVTTGRRGPTPSTPGESPQVRPGMRVAKAPSLMALPIRAPVPPPPAVNPEPQDNPPAGDTDPENPPDAP